MAIFSAEYSDEVAEKEVGVYHTTFPEIVATLGVEAVVVVPDHLGRGLTICMGGFFSGRGSSHGRGISCGDKSIH